jgi:thioredoxin-like negative regulator of GroEL
MVSLGTMGHWPWPQKIVPIALITGLGLGYFITTAQAQSAPPGNVEVLTPGGGGGLKSGLFSIESAQRSLNEAEAAVSSQNYGAATGKLQDARQVSNQLSNFYQALASSYLGADNRASDGLRKQALEAAQIRDRATFQLALVYRAQNKPEQAIPLLVEIIRSQGPSREMGIKAYQQLYEMGFVTVPPRATPPASPAPSGDKGDKPAQESGDKDKKK